MHVKITYSPNLSEIGAVKELPDDEARILIDSARAVAHDPSTDPADPAEALVKENTREQLVTIATDRGLEVESSATKPEIAAAIVGATQG